MKIVLVGINAKYIHTNLALLYLSRIGRDRLADFEAVEYTVNQNTDDILRHLYRKKPDVVLFSCYLWNIEYVEWISRDLIRLLPDLQIWLGGPEVSHEPQAELLRLPYVKGILLGEGEATFAALCTHWADKEAELLQANQTSPAGRLSDAVLAGIPGLCYRPQGTGDPVFSPPRPPMDFSEVLFPYSELNMEDFRNKLVYYESSRGCPFSCSYCLSSVDKRLRFRSLKQVCRELQFFLDHRVAQVKFIDRTFNCHHERTKAIWRYLAEHDNGLTNFHFEVAADLLDEEEIRILAGLRPGQVQLEIGVQSIHEQTLTAVNRRMDIDRVEANVLAIGRGHNVHQHLDLIIGLPYEDVEGFAASFNRLYKMRPSQLQLGFLKVLKGTAVAAAADEFGILYHRRPPYEVLQTRWLEFDQIIGLKQIEEAVETFYNSGQFTTLLAAAEGLFETPWQLYLDLGAAYQAARAGFRAHSRQALYELLINWLQPHWPWEQEKLASIALYDLYLRENLKSRPAFAPDEGQTKALRHRFYEREAEERSYLTALVYAGKTAAQLGRMTHLEAFWRQSDNGWQRQWVLFDYTNRDPLSGNAFVTVVDVEA
ncbi:MAG: B12-binding domain-containing radical SAM protein [Lachnospiraceae bacterium]|nr:B12-binding domain-containing radical SAM protein [Lachnospiraceae bacterium]MDY5742586.1 B12-binding domain-containing radical SAM protein [Lachnospiraceae bacterium]